MLEFLLNIVREKKRLIQSHAISDWTHLPFFDMFLTKNFTKGLQWD